MPSREAPKLDDEVQDYGFSAMESGVPNENNQAPTPHGKGVDMGEGSDLASRQGVSSAPRTKSSPGDERRHSPIAEADRGCHERILVGSSLLNLWRQTSLTSMILNLLISLRLT